jgi:Ca-activated chloride channel family protein
MSQFRFAYPYVLIAFPVLLLLAYVLRGWLGRRSSLVFSSLQPFQGAPVGWRVKAATILLPLMRWLVIGCGILILARPQDVERKKWFESTGVEIVLSLDTSGSMRVIDMDPNARISNMRDYDIDAFNSIQVGEINKDAKDRLGVVKKVVRTFLSQRKGDRLSLVVFGSKARTLCPLTHDTRTVNTMLQQAQIGMVGEATNLEQGIRYGLKRLVGLTVEDVIEMVNQKRATEYILEQIRTQKNSFLFDKETQKRLSQVKLPPKVLAAMKAKKPRSQIMILLTDGKHTTQPGQEGREAVLKAAKEAALYNIKIYTIGIGSQKSLTYIRDKKFGQNRVRPVRMDSYDEDLMREIARITKARFFSAQDLKGLRYVYKEIDQLEPNRFKVHQWEKTRELYLWLLLPMLGLLGLEMLSRETLFRRLP